MGHALASIANRFSGRSASSSGDIRCEEVAEPEILRPTDTILKLSTSCISGSDLRPHRVEFDGQQLFFA